jgi:glucose/arabinose dehydrogenase
MTRSTSLVAVFSLTTTLGLGACGDNAPTTDNGPDIDSAPLPDAAPIVGDAYIADAVVATCTPTAGTNVVLELVATAGDAVLLVTAPKGDARQFIVERDGVIRTMRDGILSNEPYLDISDGNDGPVLAGGERGLLGLAFHPDFAHNQRFFVYYTTSTKNVIAEYRGTAVDAADPATGKVILEIDDFAPNHNGGMIEFGTDGLLYIGTGDGGGAEDPQGTGQDVNELLGKLLRIDVDNPAEGLAYGIPVGNPFALGGGAPEILAIGLRNPWRWSFDAAAGDIYIGDVGQYEIEELDIVNVDDLPGMNFGWSQYEGDACFDGPCDPAGKTFPILTLNHDAPGDGACSIIGGQVYRGTCSPDLEGRYYYTDYCSDDLRALTWDGTAATPVGSIGGVSAPVSIHADALGELWLGTEGGEIYRIRAGD